MTTEEAKKAGFRPTRTALMNCWHLTKAGSIENVGVEFDNLSADDFPTRAKARDALRKRKLEAEHAKWLADMQAQTTPITPEQLALLHVGKDTVWAVHIAYGNSITREIYDGNKTFKCFHFSEASALAAKQRLDDYEHEKWIKNHQSQTTSITPEQGKNLCDYDTVYHPSPIEKPARVQPWPWGKDDACSKECLERGTLYFTRAAAQAALDKAKLSRYERQHPYMDDAQYAACDEARDWDGADLRVDALDKAKAEAEPLEWCERKVGELIEATDSIWDWLSECWQEPHGRHVGEKLERDDMGCVNFRARYRNPLWLAKHGNDVESHETRVGETQDEEVVTDETQDHEPVKWAERKKGDRLHATGRADEDDEYTYSGNIGIQFEGTLGNHMYYDSWLSSLATMNGQIVGIEKVRRGGMDLILRARYITPEWKAWKARQDAKASNKEPVAPVEVTKHGTTESEKSSNKPDAVSHPSHYTSHPSGVECITITKHMNFCRGNAVKYLWRAGQKGDSLDKEIEDIAKAEEYCRTEKERLIATKGAK